MSDSAWHMSEAIFTGQMSLAELMLFDRVLFSPVCSAYHQVNNQHILLKTAIANEQECY